MFHIYSDGTHAHAFIRRFFYFSDSFDAQTYFHTDKTDAESFAHRSFYLEVFARRKHLHTNSLTRRSFYTQKVFVDKTLLRKGSFTQTAFTHNSQ